MEERLEAFGLMIQDRLDARQRLLEDRFSMLMEALDSLDEILTSAGRVKSRSSKNKFQRESNGQKRWVVPQPHLDSVENINQEGPISGEIQEGSNSSEVDDFKVSDITFMQNLDAESNVIKGAPQMFDEMPQRTNSSSSLSCRSLGLFNDSDDSNHDAQKLCEELLKGSNTKESYEYEYDEVVFPPSKQCLEMEAVDLMNPHKNQENMQSVLVLARVPAEDPEAFYVKELGGLAPKFDWYVLPIVISMHGSLFQYLDTFEVSNTWVKLLDYREVNSWGKRSLFPVMFEGLPCSNAVSLQSFGLSNTKGKKHKVGLIESYASMNKEVAGVAELVPSPWTGQTTVFKFAQASALDQISSREWQIKLTDHQTNSDVIGQSDSPNSLHSRVSDSCIGVNFVSVSERENYEHTLERHAERSHYAKDGIHIQGGGAKDMPCVRPCIERVRSLVLLDVLERSSMPFTDGQPVNPHGKHAGFESQLPHDVSKPKLKLLPKSKPLDTPEPFGVAYKQNDQQPSDATHTENGGHNHLLSSHVKPGLGCNEDGHGNARLKYEQRETKACIGKNDTLSLAKQKWQHVSLTRDMALFTTVLALGMAKAITTVFDPGGYIIM